MKGELSPHQTAVQDTRTPLLYLSWGLVALAYAVAFLQRVSPQTILDVLQTDLATSAGGVGVLASGYFYGYMAMQIPAGVFVDTFGVRKVMLASLTVSAIGTFIFSASDLISIAFASRVIIACGDALIFTALLKLVAQQFSDRRFGLFSGLSQVSGYIGGVVATTPLSIAVSSFGWRSCFFWLAVVISINLALLYLTMPNSLNRQRIGSGVSGLFEAIWNALKRVWAAVKTREAWGCALTFSSHFVSATTLSGVWGIPMLMNAYGLNRIDASKPMLVFMIASMIGAIGLGFIADKVQSLFRLLIVTCLARIVLLALIAPTIGQVLGVETVTVCLAGFGLIGGGTVPLVFKSLKSIYTSNHIGVGTSLNSTLAGLIAGALQPLIGWILEKAAGMSAAGPATSHSTSGYDLLIIVLIAVSLLGIVGPILMRKGIAPVPVGRLDPVSSP